MYHHFDYLIYIWDPFGREKRIHYSCHFFIHRHHLHVLSLKNWHTSRYFWELFKIKCLQIFKKNLLNVLFYLSVHICTIKSDRNTPSPKTNTDQTLIQIHMILTQELWANCNCYSQTKFTGSSSCALSLLFLFNLFYKWIPFKKNHFTDVRCLDFNVGIKTENKKIEWNKMILNTC